MCGIFGVYKFKQPFIERSLLQEMSKTLTHRGEDDFGFFVSKNFGMGHRRLSILDLSEKGRQPLKVKNFIISYNGEIYNYLELRKELSLIHI